MNKYPNTDLYAVLGVNRRSSQAEVKAAYKKQALKSHPDRAPPEHKETATAQFKVIGEAYEILSDPHKRREYDRTNFTGPSPSFSTGPFEYEDEIDAARQHFGTSPNGQAFSFTWESSADSARRAHRGRRAGRPLGTDGFDPFELFNMMFENEFASRPSGLGGGGLFDNDPFFQNHQRMADLGGFGFGSAPLRSGTVFGSPPAPGNNTFFGGPPRQPFQSGIGRMMGGAATTFGDRGGPPGFGAVPAAAPGFQSTSESRSTRVVNGRKETMVRKVDAQGNETVHHITPEGQSVFVNGVSQPDHPLLASAGTRTNNPLSPSSHAGTKDDPIEIDA